MIIHREDGGNPMAHFLSGRSQDAIDLRSIWSFRYAVPVRLDKWIVTPDNKRREVTLEH